MSVIKGVVMSRFNFSLRVSIDLALLSGVSRVEVLVLDEDEEGS